MNIICPECAAPGTISEALVPDGGKVVVCPRCRSKFTVTKVSSKVGPVAISSPMSAEEKIRVTCPDCGVSGSLPAARVPAGGVTITCPKCKARFPVKGGGPPVPAGKAPAAAATGGTVPFVCPQCGREGQLAASLVPEGGTGTNCPGCSTRFFVKRPGEEKPGAPMSSPPRKAFPPIDAPAISAGSGLTAPTTAGVGPAVYGPSYRGRPAAAPAGPKGTAAGGSLALDDIWSEPSIGRAVAGGAGAAFAGAIVWAFITVVTTFQIGWMAIGVGALVGLAVQFFGRGTDKTFGFIGAGLALFGCVIGNLMAACAFISADPRNAGFMSVLFDALGSPVTAARIMGATFHPLDVLFYILAVSTGYKVALGKEKV